jgi:signal transduction histidine kinase
MPQPRPTTRPLDEAAADSGFDAGPWETALGRPLRGSRWMGWRLRVLVLAALVGCVALFLLIRSVALAPGLDSAWRADSHDRLQLLNGGAQLRKHEGTTLLRLRDRDGNAVTLDTLILQRSPRWLVGDEDRLRHAELQEELTQALGHGPLQLQFSDGSAAEAVPHPRGVLGLGAMFWLMCVLALAMYLIAMVVTLVRPSTRNLLYALMSLCQAGNLMFIAVESMPGLGLPAGLVRWDYPVRTALDLITAAAIVHATGMHPRRLPWRQVVAAGAWFLVGGLIALIVSGGLPGSWWYVQGCAILFGLLAIGQLSLSYRLEPHPAAVVLRRFSVVAVGTLVLLTSSVAAAERLGGSAYQVSAVGSVIWVVFLVSLFVLLPFLSRSQQVLREFSMLAGISTVATSLDLLFVAVFSFSQFASITLALFLSLGVYAGVRQWILNQMMGSNVLTTERMFEQLYRIAREVEARPERAGERLSQLLRELYEPLEVLPSTQPLRRARVVADGSTLLVPVPQLAGNGAEPATGSLMLRYAHRGTRMFTAEDERLTDRVVEQLKRAVAFDKAVEHGRSEERVRLAQDLHDDIGARLLTLMYKTTDPDTEEYLRHTLQDLKTLTRGLAASNHRLSHAAAEWKADLSQRLTAVHCELAWSFAIDRDIALSVVQWSALTRVLRELASNAIAHAQATRLDVEASYEAGCLTLQVSDNGIGRNPQAWAHGLGLGGVRKRVKQLGGHVVWSENPVQGINCLVRIPELPEQRSTP